MKKFLFVLVVMGLVFSSGPVLAKDGFYIGWTWVSRWLRVWT